MLFFPRCLDCRRHSITQMLATLTESSLERYLMNLIKTESTRLLFCFNYSFINSFYYWDLFRSSDHVCSCVPCPAPSPTTVQLTGSAATPGNLQSLLLHYTWQCSGTSQCHVHLCRLLIQYTHTYTMWRHIHIYDLIFVSIFIWKQVWDQNSIYLLFLCTYLWNHSVFHLKLLIAVNNYSNNLFTSKRTA